MSDFYQARDEMLNVLLKLDQAAVALEQSIPLDDRGLGLQGLLAGQRRANDDLVKWMAHYDRPAVDPFLVAEDIDDDYPASEPES